METEGYCLVILLVHTDNQQIRNLLNLTITHTIAKLLSSVIQLNTDIILHQSIIYFLGICIQSFVICLNRHYTSLYRSKPCRKVALSLFQDICHETVKRTKNCTMQYNRCLFLAIFINIVQIELSR